MRPRLKAAENRVGPGDPVGRLDAASMRPRLKAAENVDGVCGAGGELVASMRPRLKAAENGLRRLEAACRRYALQ